MFTQDFVGFTENSASSGIHVVEKESGKEMIEHGMKHTDRSAAYDIVAYYSGNQRQYLSVDALFHKLIINHVTVLNSIDTVCILKHVDMCNS